MPHLPTLVPALERNPQWAQLWKGSGGCCVRSEGFAWLADKNKPKKKKKTKANLAPQNLGSRHRELYLLTPTCKGQAWLMKWSWRNHSNLMTAIFFVLQDGALTPSAYSVPFGDADLKKKNNKNKISKWEGVDWKPTWFKSGKKGKTYRQNNKGHI